MFTKLCKLKMTVTADDTHRTTDRISKYCVSGGAENITLTGEQIGVIFLVRAHYLNNSKLAALGHL